MKTLQSETDWALKTLDAESSDLPDILRLLQREDFSLDDEAYEAVCILNDLKLNQDERRYSLLRELRGRVEEFARLFFTMDPEARAIEFQKLVDECQLYLELQPRLHELKKGLSVEPWKAKDNMAKDLIIDLFILPNNKRDKKYFEIQNFTPGQKRKILSDHKKLKAVHPGIAKLVPYFSTKLTVKKSPSPKAFSPVDYKQKQEEGSSFSWAACLVGLFCIKLLVFLGSSASDSSSQPVKNYQNYGTPSDYHNPNNNIHNQNIEDALNRYKKFRPQSNPANPPRPGYNPSSQPSNNSPRPGFNPSPQPGFPSGGPSIPGFP